MMKKLLVCLLALMTLALPVLAEEGGDPPLAPDLYLVSNPTTGYGWQFTVEDASVLAVTDNGFTQDPGTEGMTGAGGQQTFRLDGMSAGMTKVTFVYARPWEADEPALCTVEYNVLVDEAGNVSIFGCMVNPGL